MHGGESLGDEVDRQVGAAHPQVTDEVARLVHAFNLHKEKYRSGILPLLRISDASCCGFPFV